MENKISKNKLCKVLSEGIVHKQFANQYELVIRLDRDYQFYYNFDSFYNQDDLDFVFCIKKDFEKLDAIDNDGEYIDGKIDEEYLSYLVQEYTNEILSELKNDDRFKNIKITS
ncbi:hypothetical protein [Aliarcobacter butzleri]|uniref:hypothetical protein n=1 Tax=Aliarcobacter butzleri TaxID=28197 RepID=UPI00263EEABA|nr:hypothetical protein [Aliarcobacter butzleri]MDN5060715.1 hypothetical protein [Aliarcobacter butzleri]